jgi:hypothetical protein
MQVKMDKEDVIISFEKDFSDVIEYLGAKKGIIKTTVPYLYNGIWTYLLYEIAYYELDLDHTYSIYELYQLVKTEKVVLLSSRPYFCIKENDKVKIEDRYAEENLKTLSEYSINFIKQNGNANNAVVLGMLQKYKDSIPDIALKKVKSYM